MDLSCVFLFHQLMDIWLVFPFCLLWIMVLSSGALNVPGQVFVWTYKTQCRAAGSSGNVAFDSSRHWQAALQGGRTIYIPTGSWCGSQSVPTPCSTGIASFPSQPRSRVEVTAHCGFDFHLPNDCWCWAYCCVLTGHLCMFLETTYSKFCPSFLRVVFLLLSCNSPLYILDTRPLSDIWFANLFSHSLDWFFFIFLTVAFEA